MKIHEQAVIVAGGGSGMGAQTARMLANAGAKVALLDINEDAVRKVASEINGIGFGCDVSDAYSVEKAVAQAREVNGPARISINCAGIAPAGRVVGRNGPMPLEDFTKVINVNLVGSFNLARIVAADMLTLEPLGDSDERGVIINTASVAAYEGQIGQAAYSAAKGGVVSMTLPIARELAKFGVRVLAIAPGIMDTPMIAAMPEAVQKSLAEQIPFPHRLGKPSEFAKLAMHIIDNPMLNGEVIRLDGAIRMQPK